MYSVLILRGLAGLAGGLIANKKGRDKFVWAILCFIFPPLVLAILMIPPKVTKGITRRCPDCGKIVSKNDTVCRYCKKEMPIELVQCQECKSFVPDKEYCMNCNKKLRG